MVDLAEKIGVTYSVISGWKTGRIKKPQPDTLSKLSEYFEISPSDLLNTEITAANYESLKIKRPLGNTQANEPLPTYNLKTVPETPNERFRRLCEELDLGSQQEIADKLGLKGQSQISDMFKGKINVPTRVEDYLHHHHGISLEYLRYGSLPVRNANSGKFDIDFSKKKFVPLYPQKVFANSGIMAIDDIQEYPEDFISAIGIEEAAFAMRVHGQSMATRYNHGDIVFFSGQKSKTTIDYGYAFMVVTNEERYFKYVRRSEEKKRVKLVSHNKDFDPFEIEKDEIIHLYKCLAPVFKPNG